MHVRRTIGILIVALNCLAFTAVLTSPQAAAQLSGSRGGRNTTTWRDTELSTLTPAEVTTAIVIEGSAELRVAATRLRVVLAVSGQGESALECQNVVEKTTQQLVAAWKAAGVAEESIHEDFIAILPQYRWRIEKQESQEVAVESLSGYRLQVNLHVAAEGEEQARLVVQEAFKQGVTDIIAFDYWRPDLEDMKRQAMTQAVEVAKQKASILLQAVFQEAPRPINVQEKTTVFFPESMYESFDQAYSESIDLPSRRNLPSISAFRPKNTYYRGLPSQADRTPPDMPLRPEIVIVSRVKIYYQSPGFQPDE